MTQRTEVLEVWVLSVRAGTVVSTQVVFKTDVCSVITLMAYSVVWLYRRSDINPNLKPEIIANRN